MKGGVEEDGGGDDVAGDDVEGREGSIEGQNVGKGGAAKLCEYETRRDEKNERGVQVERVACAAGEGEKPEDDWRLLVDVLGVETEDEHEEKGEGVDGGEEEGESMGGEMSL